MAQVLTVASLWERIAGHLAPLTERPFLLRGRVADCKPVGASSHRYFTLVDRDGDGARIGAVIWRSKRPAIEGALRSAKLGPLANDMEIVVRGRLSPYPPSGRLSLVVEEIDAEATQRLARLELEEIRARLRAEGIFGANRARSVALVPLDLALVTSDQGTVQHDVRVALMERRYRFRVRLYPAPVTGAEAANELARVIGVADQGRHDLLLLVRGGGSESELTLFNQEPVVRAVATAQTPVWCAIGHTADDVLVNEVANQAFAVPRAVGDAVRERVQEFLDTLRANGQSASYAIAGRITAESKDVSHIRELASTVLGQRRDDAYHWHAGMLDQLVAACRELADDWREWSGALGLKAQWAGVELVREHRRDLERVVGELDSAVVGEITRVRDEIAALDLFGDARRWVEDSRRELAGMWRLSQAHDPRRRLKEGYAVLVDPTGRWLRSRGEVSASVVVEARMHDGGVKLEVRDG